MGSVLREKWHLDRLLGIGGMAAVYAATHRNGKVAAIKVLHPEAALVPDVKARFLREGYLANKVRHPGAVSILDDDVDLDGTVFLVMELLEGETLETRWQREEMMRWHDALVIADKVLDVLVAAHSKAIVHRDLKPGNVFVCADGSVKILDFGIARLQSITQSSRDTGGHLSLGTPGFMAPEQARGQWDRVDGRTDLWALGATMFAVISGRCVHEAATVNEQLLAAMTQPATPIREHVANVPGEVAEFIDRVLAYDRERRFADASSMQVALRAAYEKETGESITSAPALLVPGLPAHRSVHPDAPTVAAADLDSVRLSHPDAPTVAASELDSIRLSTSRPVTETTGALARRPRFRSIAVGSGIAITALLVGWLVFRSRAHGAEQTKLEAAGAAPASAIVQAAIETTPRPVAADPTSPSAALATPSLHAPAPRSRSAHPALKGSATPAPAPSGTPPPPTNVDIFTRRK